MICAEIDPTHSKQLEIDEQQQNVIDANFFLMKHFDEGGNARVDRDRPNPEKRKVMEHLNPQVPKAVRPSMNPYAHPIRPLHTHSPLHTPKSAEKIKTAI